MANKQIDEGFIEQIKEAKVSVAKTALANPHVFPEGQELMAARRALAGAKVRLSKAETAWTKLIEPAKGWAPDPLKETK